MYIPVYMFTCNLLYRYFKNHYGEQSPHYSPFQTLLKSLDCLEVQVTQTEYIFNDITIKYTSLGGGYLMGKYDCKLPVEIFKVR